MSSIRCGTKLAVVLLALASLIAGCSDNVSPDVCRFDPASCTNGEAGAFCLTDHDCIGICCTARSNCAGGMCTYACRDDRDCPLNMACEHDVCFYRCEYDTDCAFGQSCEHDNTVCEWP
jgi:hypothetical protein